jgi:hypothetical protein
MTHTATDPTASLTDEDLVAASRRPGGSPRIAKTEKPANQSAILNFPPNEKTRQCYSCGGWWAPDRFAVDASKSSGRKSVCKVCDSKRSLEHYYAHRRVKKLKDGPCDWIELVAPPTFGDE